MPIMCMCRFLYGRRMPTISMWVLCGTVICVCVICSLIAMRTPPPRDCVMIFTATDAAWWKVAVSARVSKSLTSKTHGYLIHWSILLETDLVVQ